MPFVFRTNDTPPLNRILEIEQIVIVDRTGPVIAVGVSPGAACLVGEFPKGPTVPTRVASAGEIASLFGGVVPWLSQNRRDLAAYTQDGSAVFYDGNGPLQLKGKTFGGLVLLRVDTDCRTSAAASASYSKLTVTVTYNAADLTAGLTNKDILIPAGTLFFTDPTLAGSTYAVATSEDFVIPKGTLAATVDFLIRCAFVKAGPLPMAPLTIDTVPTPALPGVLSTITAVSNVGAMFTPIAAPSLTAFLALAYVAAIPATLPGTQVTDNITVIWSARNQTTIRAALWDNAKVASESGRGRTACVSAPPALTASAVDASAAKAAAQALPAAEFPGEAADRVMTNFPYAKVFSTELGGINVDVSPDGWKASLFSLLAEEVSSGVENAYLQVLQGLEDAFQANPLSKQDYINFKAAGVSALRKDPAVGWWFQSGVTSVIPATYSTRAPDNRRRFADFVQDTIVSLAARYNKKPGTTERVDALVGELDGFLSGLLSEQNPSQQRIEGYFIDAKTANTPQLTAIGIRVIIVKVRMLGDLNDLVFETQIGSTVEIP